MSSDGTDSEQDEPPHDKEAAMERPFSHADATPLLGGPARTATPQRRRRRRYIVAAVAAVVCVAAVAAVAGALLGGRRPGRHYKAPPVCPAVAARTACPAPLNTDRSVCG